MRFARCRTSPENVPRTGTGPETGVKPGRIGILPWLPACVLPVFCLCSFHPRVSGSRVLGATPQAGSLCSCAGQMKASADFGPVLCPRNSIHSLQQACWHTAQAPVE
jgi:hypothetical protein